MPEPIHLPAERGVLYAVEIVLVRKDAPQMAPKHPKEILFRVR